MNIKIKFFPISLLLIGLFAGSIFLSKIILPDLAKDKTPSKVEPREFIPAAPSISGFRGAEPRTEGHSSTSLQARPSGAWVTNAPPQPKPTATMPPETKPTLAVPPETKPTTTPPPELKPPVTAHTETSPVLPPPPVFISPPVLTLSGIVYDKQKSYAIVNNRILREGEIIEGATLTRIDKDKAEFLFQNKEFEVKIK